MWMAHHWKCSRSGQRGLSATCSGGKCPWPRQVPGTGRSLGSLSTQTVLGFCDRLLLLGRRGELGSGEPRGAAGADQGRAVPGLGQAEPPVLSGPRPRPRRSRRRRSVAPAARRRPGIAPAPPNPNPGTTARRGCRSRTFPPAPGAPREPLSSPSPPEPLFIVPPVTARGERVFWLLDAPLRERNRTRLRSELLSALLESPVTPQPLNWISLYIFVLAQKCRVCTARNPVLLRADLAGCAGASLTPQWGLRALRGHCDMRDWA